MRTLRSDVARIPPEMNSSRPQKHGFPDTWLTPSVVDPRGAVAEADHRSVHGALCDFARSGHWRKFPMQRPGQAQGRLEIPFADCAATHREHRISKTEEIPRTLLKGLRRSHWLVRAQVCDLPLGVDGNRGCAVDHQPSDCARRGVHHRAKTGQISKSENCSACFADRFPSFEYRRKMTAKSASSIDKAAGLVIHPQRKR